MWGAAAGRTNGGMGRSICNYQTQKRPLVRAAFPVSNLKKDQKRILEPAMNMLMSLQPPAAEQLSDDRLKLR